MTAKVRQQIDLLPDAAIIPIGCVYELNGQPVVFTKKSPNTPSPVKLGPRNDFFASVEGIEIGTEISWQPGKDKVQPLGYAEYQQRLRPPASKREQFFTEMEKRQLTFDYEAFRNRPPEPPGGAPGGTQAMLKQLGIPGGEMAIKGGQITLPPEMMKELQKPGSGNIAIMRDSSKAAKKPPADGVSPNQKGEAMKFHVMPGTAKSDSTEKREMEKQ
jgi:hypothetical protein